MRNANICKYLYNCKDKVRKQKNVLKINIFFSIEDKSNEKSMKRYREK